MLGRKRLDELAALKQVLLAESSLNRLVLRREFGELCLTTTWLDEATCTLRKLAPQLLILAPLAGFLLARRSRQPGSCLDRVIAALRWLGPLYDLWQRLPQQPAAKAADPPSEGSQRTEPEKEPSLKK